MHDMSGQSSGTISGQHHVPGEGGIWFFIFGDLLFFATFFVTFIYYRAHDLLLYDQSQRMLSAPLGLANTLLLLTSSLLVATALRAFRQQRPALCRRLVLGAAFLGAGFVVNKAIEWSQKFSEHITIQTNEFFMFYFMFTGIHLIHVIIGLGVLLFLYRRVSVNPGAPATLAALEGGAAFWHLVDLLWVVLFALLYLVH